MDVAYRSVRSSSRLGGDGIDCVFSQLEGNLWCNIQVTINPLNCQTQRQIHYFFIDFPGLSETFVKIVYRV